MTKIVPAVGVGATVERKKNKKKKHRQRRRGINISGCLKIKV